MNIKNKPKILSDILPSRGSVFSVIPQRVNLSFEKERKKLPILEFIKAGVVLAIAFVLILGKTAAPRVEEVAPVVPVDLAEVKVESEEKKAEREAEKAAEEKE